MSRQVNIPVHGDPCLEILVVLKLTEEGGSHESGQRADAYPSAFVVQVA